MINRYLIFVILKIVGKEVKNIEFGSKMSELSFENMNCLFLIQSKTGNFYHLLTLQQVDLLLEKQSQFY